MKNTILVLCLLCAAGAWAQNAPVLSNTAQPVQMIDHAQRASEHAMAQESSLLSSNPYTYAKGEVPLADLGSPRYQTPLGDIARAFRKEHAGLPKAVKSLQQ
jgi:prophage DNA circulation protein